MSTENVTLYVYYKIPMNQSTLCSLAVKQMQQAIALCYPEISMRLQKRPVPDAANQETWMEIYANVLSPQLEHLIVDLLELAAIHGLPLERRTEVFIDF